MKLRIAIIISIIFSVISTIISLFELINIACLSKDTLEPIMFFCLAMPIVAIIYNSIFLEWITYVESSIERMGNKIVNLSNRVDRRICPSNNIKTQKNLDITQTQSTQNLNTPLDYPKIPATYRVECPNCNNMLTVYDDDIIIYCNKCGQKIQIG